MSRASILEARDLARWWRKRDPVKISVVSVVHTRVRYRVCMYQAASLIFSMWQRGFWHSPSSSGPSVGDHPHDVVRPTGRLPERLCSQSGQLAE